MRVDISYKYLVKNDVIENVLDKNLAKVERRIMMFRKNDPIHVSIHLEKNPHREQYFCRAQVYLPSRLIKSEMTAQDLPKAIHKCFQAISTQLQKVKYRVETHLRKLKIEKNY